jgi:hypothetical protein
MQQQGCSQNKQKLCPHHAMHVCALYAWLAASLTSSSLPCSFSFHAYGVDR